VKIIKLAKEKVKDEDLQDYQDFGWTSVDVSKEILDKMTNFQKDIPEEELFVKKEGDWSYGLEDEIHVTVKWGIHTLDPDEVKKALEGQKSGSAKLAEVSIFDNDEYDVLKVDVISPDLRRLNKAVSDNLEVTDTHPDYKPHLTIAYLKKGEGKKYVGDKAFEDAEWDFDVVNFKNAKNEESSVQLEKK